MNAYDVEEAKRLLEAARESTIYVPVLLAFQTGMRRGELCGLKWEDIDFDRGTLAVRRSVEQTKKGILGQEKATMRFKEPKTGKSRIITMPKVLTIELRRHKGEQAERRLQLGEAWQDQGLVCPNDDGTLRTPDGLSRAFARLVRKAGLPHLRLHDCRHTHATLLLANGENVKVVAERLGHSTSRLTLDPYAHVLEGMQKGAADRLDAMFGGG
jgi:integrase